MKKKIILMASLVFVLVCLLALAVSAECVHEDSWEIKAGDGGALGNWEAINTCAVCGVVVADEFYAPVVESLGYSYYEGSFVQGFTINNESKAKYEEYTGFDFEYGIVAGVNSVVGNNPLDGEGNATNEKAVSYNLSANSLEHFDVKIVNIPKEKYDEKIIACAYVSVNGQVTYMDNDLVDNLVCGVSVNEIVDLLDNGVRPDGVYEYRQLTAEEMDIMTGGAYWFSSSNSYNVRLRKDNNYQRYAATRMFSREELTSDAYVVISEGWVARPEIWKVDENGNVKKNNPRPYGSAIGAGTYTVAELFKDTDEGQSDFVYLAFNVSDSGSSDIREMTPEGIARALRIYVPYNANVEAFEVENENVSVEGLKLLEWDKDSLISNAYWNCSANSTLYKGNDTSKTYYATKQFTEETLPVGSVIEVSAGYVYRREYWVNGNKVGSRGSLNSSYRIVVTEDFWDTESERAFNISKIIKENLTADDWDEVASAFKIYIPVN